MQSAAAIRYGPRRGVICPPMGIAWGATGGSNSVKLPLLLEENPHKFPLGAAVDDDREIKLAVVVEISCCYGIRAARGRRCESASRFKLAWRDDA